MTEAQLATLKAHILTNTAVADFLASRNDTAIADWYNAQASPAFYVWRNAVTQDEIMQNGFDWTQVDNQTVGKARIWEWLFNNADRSINPTKANVRAGIMECWKGTTAMLAVRLVVLGHCQKVASNLERLFATGTGTATTVDGVGPGTTTVYGEVSVWNISDCLNH